MESSTEWSKRTEQECRTLCQKTFSMNSFLIEPITNYLNVLEPNEKEKFLTEFKKNKTALEKISQSGNFTDLHKLCYFQLSSLFSTNMQFRYDAQRFEVLISLLVDCAHQPSFHEINPIFTLQGPQSVSPFFTILNCLLWKPSVMVSFLKELAKAKTVNFNEQNNTWGNTFFHLLIANAKFGICIQFIDTLMSVDNITKCNLNVNLLSSGFGTSPLHLAIAKGYIDLDSAGAAVGANYLTLVETLITAGADVNLPTAKFLGKVYKLIITLDKTPAGYTPLHLACARRDYEMITKLRDYGADPNVLTEQKLTALEVLELSFDERKKIIDSVSGEGLNNFITYAKKHSTEEHLHNCQKALSCNLSREYH